jgi:predicted Rossmann fold nucleotide-binding protein DprA/Smf involved in DNA uptake
MTNKSLDGLDDQTRVNHWLAVVGTREVTSKIRRDIARNVTGKIKDGCSIVSGGATGADHEAAKIAYELQLPAWRFRIYLPVTLDAYCDSLQARAKAGKCRPKDARETIALLRRIRRVRPGVIYDETPFSEVNTESFHARNELIVVLADELLAFRADHSAGTTFTIERAQAKGIPVSVFDY